MLVLSRKRGQRIILTTPDGLTITLTVTAIQGDKARIGIDAPVDVDIRREELEEKGKT